MKKYLASLALGLVVALSAVAIHAADEVPPNVAKNLHVQAAAGACQPFTALDAPKLGLRGNGLALVNLSFHARAKASCAPNVFVSGNGTTEVGLYVGNNDGGDGATTTTTCVMWYNTAGSGPKQITKSVMVSPGLIGKVAWQTNEFVKFGGPVAITCDLAPRGSVLRVYTISQQTS